MHLYIQAYIHINIHTLCREAFPRPKREREEREGVGVRGRREFIRNGIQYRGFGVIKNGIQYRGSRAAPVEAGKESAQEKVGDKRETGREWGWWGEKSEK